MSGPMKRYLLLFVAALLFAPGAARAESSDLKREIRSQQSAADDLQALDKLRAVADEIALLKTWLDEAWNNESRAQSVLNRCVNQADLIRVKITLSQLKADLAAREQKAKESRDKVKRTQAALEEAIIKKKAMELNAK
jgi:hypothetical protein